MPIPTTSDEVRAQFTITWADLARLIEVCLPHVSKDWQLPVLCRMQFREQAGHAEMSATDRYSIAWCRSTTPVPAGLNFSLDVADWRSILRLFKPDRYTPSMLLTFTVGAEQVTVTNADGVFNVATLTDLTATYQLPDGQTYPVLDHVRPAHDAQPAAVTPALNPRYLRRLPGAPIDTNTVCLAPQAVGPVYFAGPDWLVAIMAIRAPEEDAQSRLDQWRKPAPTTAEVDK